jgi:3-oxoacyl-[acyl-carrier protein] reductase
MVLPDTGPGRATTAVAIVTRASYGTGREVVRQLACRGYAIAVVYLDDQRRAEATVDEVLAADGTAVAVRADLADDLDVERLFTETIAAFGGIDVVVHTMHRPFVLYQHAARHLRRGSAIFSVSGADHITTELAQQLRERGIAVNGVAPGIEAPGAELGVTDLIALLDQWRHSPANSP